MIERLRDRTRGEQGFTLIELLVVILIIGILAAIAIPSFISQRTKAQDAAAKEGVLSARTAMEACATDNNGTYTSCDESALIGIEPTLNNVSLTVDGSSPTDGYTLVATSDSTTTFQIARDGSGNITRTCSDAGSGGCNSDGEW